MNTALLIILISCILGIGVLIWLLFRTSNAMAGLSREDGNKIRKEIKSKAEAEQTEIKKQADSMRERIRKWLKYKDLD